MGAPQAYSKDRSLNQNCPKKQFFLLNPKYFTIFAPVISPRLGIMSFGWGGCRHNKGVKTGSPIKLVLWGVQRALCLANWNLENSISTQDIAAF